MVRYIAFFTSFLFTLNYSSSQVVIKMAMPQQAQNPVSATILFDEYLPLDIPVILGTMGFNVTGGTEPYTCQWMENNSVHSTGNITTIIPKAGNTYSLIVKDDKNCSVTLPLVTEASSGGRKKLDNTGNRQIQIGLEGNYLSIKINEPDPGKLFIEIYDLNGRKHLGTSFNENLEIPLHFVPGLYLIHLRGNDVYYVDKLFFR